MAEGHFPGHQDRRIPLTGAYRHVSPYPRSSQSSESSLSSDDEGPSEHIHPEESASRSRPPGSNVSARSRQSGVPAPPQRTPSALSRHSSHRGAPIPPTAEDNRQYQRVIEHSVTRERELRHRPPRFPEEQQPRRPQHPPRRESEGSLDSSESSSWEGAAHVRAYYPHGYYPPSGGHPHGPYQNPRRPSYEHPGHGALMHMGPPEPYYRDHRPRYGPYDPHPMSPPLDPYYGDMRPPMRPVMGPRPTSYHEPHYAGAMMPAYHHHYAPPPHQPITYVNQHPPSSAVSPPLSTPKEDDPELKRLQLELAMVKEAQIREQQARDLMERERKIALEAELAALQKAKAERELKEQREAEISEAKKEERRKTEEELKAKADKAQAEIDKKAAEEKKKMEALEAKKKELEAEIKAAKGDPDDAKAPVRLKDTVLGRKFDFPWGVAKKWNETLRLISQAYAAFPAIQRQIAENRFELVGPEQQIILPSVWETTVQPGWEVSILVPPEQLQQQPATLPGGAFLDSLGWDLDATHLDGKKRHKSSSRDKRGKSSSHDPHRSSSSRRKRMPDLVDAPGLGAMHPVPMGAAMAAATAGPLFGEAPMPPPPPAHIYPEMKLEKDDRGARRKDRERDKKKKSSSGGLFGLGRR